MTVEASEEVTMFGILVLRVDVELAVEVDVVAVAIEVANGVADELGVLLVGEGLEGLYSRVELARSAAPLHFLWDRSCRLGRTGGIRARVPSCPRGVFGLRTLGGGVGDVYHRAVRLGRWEDGGLLRDAHGPGVLDVGPKPARRVLDALLVGEGLDVVEAVAGS